MVELLSLHSMVACRPPLNKKVLRYSGPHERSVSSAVFLGKFIHPYDQFFVPRKCYSKVSFEMAQKLVYFSNEQNSSKSI